MNEILKSLLGVKDKEEEKRERTNIFYTTFYSILVSLSIFIADKMKIVIKKPLFVISIIVSISWTLFLLKNGAKLTRIKNLLTQYAQEDSEKIFIEIEGKKKDWIHITTSYIEMVLPFFFTIYAFYFLFHTTEVIPKIEMTQKN